MHGETPDTITDFTNTDILHDRYYADIIVRDDISGEIAVYPIKARVRTMLTMTEFYEDYKSLLWSFGIFGIIIFKVM